MDYQEALIWVHSLPRLAPTPGVEHTEALLERLGHPEQELKFVHVVGTNGKGSATVMLASVLREAGYRTGANISPYVLDFRERFLLNGEQILPAVLARLLTQVRAAAEGLTLVEFDAVTAAALLWFAQEKCDIVCLEAGLGGRLDSTNAVQNTLVACVMKIGLDHTELLGDTCAQIAAEKCGVFKNNCTVVCYPEQPREALDEITLRAAHAHCPLVVPEMEDLSFYRAQPFENRVNYGGYDLCIPFPGRHQACNAMVVVHAALALCEKGFSVSDEAIEHGIAAARFPARIEVLSRKPLVLLDGAHNPDGAGALADTLRRARVRGLAAVAGILHGKNAPVMLETLSPYIQTLYTVTPDSPRAMSAEELAQAAAPYYPRVTACASVEEALSLARQEVEQGLLVWGSLYLAAQARSLLVAYTPNRKAP